jgi:hypothetical protein
LWSASGSRTLWQEETDSQALDRDKVRHLVKGREPPDVLSSEHIRPEAILVLCVFRRLDSRQETGKILME